MEKEYIKEKIGILKTEMNLLWSAIFITFGGSIAIFLNKVESWQWFLVIAGLLLSAVFLNAFVIKRNEAVKLIKILNGGK